MMLRGRDRAGIRGRKIREGARFGVIVATGAHFASVRWNDGVVERIPLASIRHTNEPPARTVRFV